MTFTLAKRARRPAWLGTSLAMLALPLAGCLGGGGGSSDDVLSGTFVDSPVAGLDYHGSQTAASKTGDSGEFSYRSGEILTFAIGNLVLGSAPGGQMLTPLDLVDGAAGADDQRVLNQLILLQSLDADGNLNNGIQVSSQIRDEVSLVAGTIDFDQSPADFRAAIAGLIADLEAAGAFSDTDPRARSVTDASEEQSLKASSPISVTPTGTTTSVMSPRSQNARGGTSVGVVGTISRTVPLEPPSSTKNEAMAANPARVDSWSGCPASACLPRIAPCGFQRLA